MDELQDVLKQHAMIMKATTALFYGILVSIAMNFFWEPGHIYSSGITGLAQLIGTLTKNGPVHLSTALMLFEHPAVCFGVEADRSQVYAVHDFGSFLLIGHD